MASIEAAQITKFDIYSNEGGTISLLGKGALPLVEYRECILDNTVRIHALYMDGGQSGGDVDNRPRGAAGCPLLDRHNEVGEPGLFQMALKVEVASLEDLVVSLGRLAQITLFQLVKVGGHGEVADVGQGGHVHPVLHHEDRCLLAFQTLRHSVYSFPKAKGAQVPLGFLRALSVSLMLP